MKNHVMLSGWLFTWEFMGIDSLFEEGSSGHSGNCSLILAQKDAT